MDFSIAIISHDRLKLFEQKTINFLKNQNIDFSKVYVFVSTKSQEEYKELEEKYKFNLLIYKDNLLKIDNNSVLNARNNIIDYFEEGAKILEIDDDIDKIIDFSTEKEVSNFVELIEESFNLIKDGGLFGFSAQSNKFFATCKDLYGLHSIINSCCGYINDKRIKLTVYEKEDYERCIQFYNLDLTILKRGNYGIKTNYWKNKGGIQSRYSWEKRLSVQKETSLWLNKLYPELTRIQIRKNGIYDIRFRKIK